MKPCGIILTFMRWREWKWLAFNIALFLWQIVFMVVGKMYGKIKVRWRDIWRAAQVCHVRLCLDWTEVVNTLRTWEYISFSHPVAKLDYWRIGQCDGKRFSYRDPTFTILRQLYQVKGKILEIENIQAMLVHAHLQVGKKYDELQLISYCVNLLVWILWCPSWGQEIIKWFNRPGGHETCSSGVIACLRYLDTDLFKGYDTAMVPPCLFPLSENWEEK